jgi:hypothetical protein
MDAKKVIFDELRLILICGRRVIVKSKRKLSPRSFERQAEVQPAISFSIRIYYEEFI